MSQRYIGSSISPTAAPTSSTSTTGVWSVNDQYQAKNAGNWPLYTPPATTDPYFGYVSMLLPGNGTNGAQNNTFLDSSTNNFTITRTGNTTQGTFTPYGANWSNYFDGTGDYATVPLNSAFAIGTADFTVEAWVNPAGTNPQYAAIFAGITYGSSSDWGLYLSETTISSALKPSFLFVNGGTAFSSGTTLTIGQWSHIAVTRQGTTVRFFINGALTATTTSSANLLNSIQKGIGGGSNGNGNTLINGSISNLRVVSGTAVYTSAFTPSTTPLQPIAGTILLTCQSNRFIDNSPNNFTVTKNGDTSVQRFSPFEPATVTPYYSGYFDGSGDYLTFPSSYLPSTTGTAFTLEFWICPTRAYPSDNSIISSGNIEFNIVSSPAGQLRFDLPAGSTNVLNSGATSVVYGAWNHVALTRTTGNAYTLYLNGVSVGTGSSATAITGVTTFGYRSTSSLQGCVSNLRVCNSLVYSGNFTPPTAPLTAISGTSLLTCQSSTFIDNSGNSVAITVTGNAQPITATPFTPTVTSGVPYSAATIGGSAYFDGSGDYLSVASNAAFGLGTGDFNIDFWVYPTVNSRQDWVDITNGSQRAIVYYNGTIIGFYSAPANAIVISGPAMILNAWTHIALSRQSGSMRLFVNGAQVGSTYTTVQDYSTANSVTIGKDSAGSTYVTGLMSNIRIVKGTAVYTSNFAPPVAPVTAITNTQLLVNGTNAGIIDNAEINDLETVGTVQVGTGQSKFGGSSVYFPAKTDVLNVKSNRAVATLGGDFTIECWVYPTSTTLTTIWGVLDARAAGASATSWFLGLSNYSSGWLMSFYNGAFSYGTTRIQANTWTHCAWVRVGSTLTFYVNGVAGGTATISGAITGGTTTVFVGNKDNANAGYGTIGYIEDLRITNGYARYTTTFTPPTAAFPTA